jgi:hypothetical protein
MMIGVVAVLVMALPAVAGREWCAKDPIVALNGNVVQILVAVPEGMDVDVTGPIHVAIETPEDVTHELLFTDSGFNGFGETVAFESVPGKIKRDGSFKAEIDVTVPVAAEPLPMQVTVITDTETIVREGSTSGMTIKLMVGGS